MKGKALTLIVGTIVVPGMVVGALFASSKTAFKPSKANGLSIVLDDNLQPSLDNTGAGTMVDEKGVTWEYHNASDNPSGHIILNSDSYFGVSPSTTWGITAITSVEATFTGSDLWLLKSTDGIVWHEAEILTSGQATSSANKWRYIRFYNYSSTVSITSVTIEYDCSGISAPEDIDSAKVGNVITTTGLNYSSETSSLSPNSVGGEAVRFTKSGSGSTTLTIGFNESYTLQDVAYAKIEFDIWTTNVNYGKTIEVLNTDGSYTSSKFTAASGLHDSNPTNSYVWSSLGNS